MVDKVIVTCIAATTETKPNDTPNYNNVKFTEENLHLMCKDIHEKDIPITVNFDQDNIIGKVLSGKVIDKTLKITAELNYKEPLISTYIVPGFRVNDAEIDGKDRIEYKDITLLQMGTTLESVDKNVTVFAVIGKE